MAISEPKMQIVIANYFKDECDVNTSIKQAFEKGFRIGVKKGASTNGPQGWIPCSERLPRASITAPCLMTIMFPRAQAVSTAYGYRYHEDIWVYATFEGYEYTEKGIAEVVAWMPQPRPWKGTDDDTV